MNWFQCLESNQHHFLDKKEVGQMECLSSLTKKAVREAQKEPTQYTSKEEIL